MNPFETETMADLYLRQGHRAEALAIYRRLVCRTLDEHTRHRVNRQIAALDQSDGAAIATPGVRAHWSPDELTIEWRLPTETAAPSLEVLLVKSGADGVFTERRHIEVDRTAGQLKLGAKDLHSVRVAAGSRGPRGFVPLARG